MNRSRLVAIFTSNRAEYGLQYPVIKAVDEHPGLKYCLLVSGAHLDPNFGKSFNEIIDDGFEIEAKINISMGHEQEIATAQAIASAIDEVSRALHRIKPDFLVVYADRFEGFAAVVASSQMSIPTVHIEGGDNTEGGALDDSIRHAMTKLSHLHMTTNEDAAQRIISMGEEPWRVKVVGLPTLDLIRRGDFSHEKDLVKEFSIDLSRPMLIFTQHSVTTEFQKASSQITASLVGIQHFLDLGAQCIMTYPNNDVGSQDILDQLKAFYASNAKNNVNLHLKKSLGRRKYHGLLALARNRSNRVVCVGNSSSGIKETCLFGCPTLNIGTRQNGRLRSENVLSCDYDTENIISGINTCLFDDNFRDLCRDAKNPYGTGNAGKKIADFLASVPLNSNLIQKKMTIKCM